MSEDAKDATLFVQFVDLDFSQLNFPGLQRWGLQAQLTSHSKSFQLL
jgi:hypothetical protein